MEPGAALHRCQIIGWFIGAAAVVALFGDAMRKIAAARGIDCGVVRSPERAVHVGNRLDSEQLSEPTAVVTSFSGLPNALAGMAPSRVPAGAV